MIRIRLQGLLGNIKINGFLLIFLAYAPGVFKESFWSDDYPALMDTPGFALHVLRDGRPTAAGIFSISFSLLDDPSNAWILRSFALLALLLIFLFLSNRIVNPKNRNIGIISMAVAFCLPSFQMYVHWSLTWLFLWAGLAGLYSYHFWSSIQIPKKVLAVLLLVCALTIYPPTALFFFATLVVLSALNESMTSKLVSELRQASILLTISGIFAALIVFVSLQIAGVSANKRVSILGVSDIPEKFVWFLSRPIVVGFRPFMVDSPTPIAALLTSLPAMAILFFGIWKQSNNLRESIFVRLFWFSLAFVFSLIPIIITADNQVEFRVIPGYSWGIAVLAVFFLVQSTDDLLRRFVRNSKIQNLLIALPLLALSLLSIISINLHYSELFGSPYQQKNAFLNNSLTTCSKENRIRNIVIIPPELPFPSRPRLGVFSMSTDLDSSWVPKPNVELLLRKKGVEGTVRYIELRPVLADLDPAACIIDLEEFRKSLK